MHFKLLNSEYSELNELQECSLPNWYNKFEKISIKTEFINIPQNILNYLKDEIILLPKECYSNDTTNEEFNTDFGDTSNTDNNNVDDDSDSEEDDTKPEPEFIEFSNKISEIIKEFDNCFLKTNWHSPKDAFWITAGQTLKIKDITDVYQLLKASSIVKQDLNYNGVKIPEENLKNSIDTITDKTDFYLIFRKWLEIHSGTEFRCFVKNNLLIAISPRDWPQYHKHIDEQKFEIISDILSIFKEKIQYKFGLENYCFDVIRDYKDHVILIDFSPFNSKFTESLAFDWNEFNLDIFQNIDKPELRYLAENCFIQPNCRNNYGYPQDIINVFQNNSENGCTLTDLLTNRVRNGLFIQENDSEN